MTSANRSEHCHARRSEKSQVIFAVSQGRS
jgi:hypothetical protein